MKFWIALLLIVGNTVSAHELDRRILKELLVTREQGLFLLHHLPTSVSKPELFHDLSAPRALSWANVYSIATATLSFQAALTLCPQWLPPVLRHQFALQGGVLPLTRSVAVLSLVGASFTGSKSVDLSVEAWSGSDPNLEKIENGQRPSFDAEEDLNQVARFFFFERNTEAVLKFKDDVKFASERLPIHQTVNLYPILANLEDSHGRRIIPKERLRLAEDFEEMMALLQNNESLKNRPVEEIIELQIQGLQDLQKLLLSLEDEIRFVTGPGDFASTMTSFQRTLLLAESRLALNN